MLPETLFAKCWEKSDLMYWIEIPEKKELNGHVGANLTPSV